MVSIPFSPQAGNSTPVSKRPPKRKDGPALIKSGRTNRTRKGEIFDRSVPLTPADARAMATTLATLTGFADVEALSSKRASADGKTWFVRWHRSAAIVPAETGAAQEIRVERAIHQAPEMEPFLACDDPAVPKRWILHRYPDSDQFGLYLTTFDSCTCPDFQFRGRKLTYCKHIHFFVGIWAQQRRKRTAADRELDARLNGW